jgi:hypothetical protein
MTNIRSQKAAKRVALVQYAREDWDRWRETVDDRERFDQAYDEWHAEAQAMGRRLERAGLEIVWIPLAPDAIAEWCRSRNYPNNNEKRFQFAAERIGNVRVH